MATLTFARPLTRSKLSEEIENILLKGIITGELRAGEKLPAERDLAHELDVNRSTVRAGLSKLESLDLIEIRHGDGVYVKDFRESGNLELIRAMVRIDEQQRDSIIATLLEFRTIIGPQMASLAAVNRTDEHLANLEEVIKDKELSVLEKDIKVHHIIALASANTLYLFLLNFFNKFMTEFGHLYFDCPKNRERSVRFHEDIYQALRKQDAGKAAKIMGDVMKYSEDVVIANLQNVKKPRR